MKNEIPGIKGPLSEDVLTFQLKNKSHHAFSYLYDHYSAALLLIIRNILNHKDLAADVLQQTFIKIWINISDFDPQKGRLFTWMVRIAKNTAIDVLRSKRFEILKKTDPLIENDRECQCCFHKCEYHLIEKQIIRLAHKYRVVIELIYLYGYTAEETAGLLNIPAGTIKTRRKTAMQLLRKSLRIQHTCLPQKNFVAI